MINTLELPELLTAKQVAQIVPVTANTIRRWGRKGVLTMTSIGNRQWFSRDEILEKMKPLLPADDTSLASL